MAILDCETYESTITSICQIYNADKNEVVSFLTGIDLDAEYARSNISQDCDEYIKIFFEKRFGSPSTEIDAVMWFHLTRTLKNSDFSEGILPLGIAIEKVWKILLSILKEPEQRKNLTIMQVMWIYDFRPRL